MFNADKKSKNPVTDINADVLWQPLSDDQSEAIKGGHDNSQYHQQGQSQTGATYTYTFWCHKSRSIKSAIGFC